MKGLLFFFEKSVIVYFFILQILSGLMHLWTIYIAYKISGAFWALVTLALPVASQIFWGFYAWNLTGFNSPYIQWLVILVVIWIIFYIFSLIISSFEKFS